MTTYVIDFESTFSAEHTLTKHSIEEYVRHPKFEVIGMGYKSLHDGFQDWLPYNEVESWLGYVTAQPDCKFTAHHAQFDGFIMSEVYHVAPCYWYDTLSMSRALYPRLEKHSLEALATHLGLGSPKVVPYNKFRGLRVSEISDGLMDEIGRGCLHDVNLTHKLYESLVHNMPESELDLIDATIRLYTEPLLVGDQALLFDAVKEAVIARETKMADLGLTDGVLRSAKKFACLLRGAGLADDAIPTKISPANGKTTYAFAKSDLGFLALREHEDPTIRAIVEARIAAQTSIHETRAGRLLSTAERGSIPVYLKHYGAHTGRPSGGDKSNFTNLPRGSKLRHSLKAPEGHTLVWGDASQIECRITAELASCDYLLDAFREGRDVYSEFGEEAFNCEVSKKVNPDLRFFSKETVLGCGYGMGGVKFHPYLESKIRNMEEPIPMLPRDETDRLIALFRRRCWQIPRLWNELDYFLDRMYKDPNFEGKKGPVHFVGRRVILPNGMFLDYQDMRYLRKGEALTEKLVAKKDGYYIGATSLWGGSFLENIVQALARIIISDVWLDLRHDARCVLWVYDELVFAVHLKIKDYFTNKLGDRMRVAPEWLPDVPLDCELGSGIAYGK